MSLAQKAANAFAADPAFNLMKAEGVKSFTWLGRNGSSVLFVDGSALEVGAARKGVTSVTVR